MTAERADVPYPVLEADAARSAAAAAGMRPVLADTSIFRVLLRHPPVARIVADIVEAIVLDSTLDARLRELAILRVGWRMASVYEWSNHYPIAQGAGMTDDEALAVRAGPSAPGLGEVERAVLTLVDEVLDHDAASRAVMGAARQAVGTDEALLELLAIPGFYRAIASMLRSLDVPLEEGRPPWPPDGLGPGS